MKVLHRNPRPTAPRAHAHSLGPLCVAPAARRAHPLAVFALTPLLLATCTDDVTANCPPPKHPEVLAVPPAAGG